MSVTVRNILFVIVLILIMLGLLAWYIFSRPSLTLPTTATSSPLTTATVPVPVAFNAPATQLAEHTQYYDIDLQYPSATPIAGSGANAAAVNTMKTFVQNTSESFKEDGNFSNLSPAQIAQMNGNKESLSSTYKLYRSPATVSYVFTLSSDTLGAHPNSYFRTFVFDAKSGGGIALSDLFTPGADYLNTLSTLSRTALSSQLGKDSDSTFINPGTTPNDDNFQNFAIDSANLVLLFPPYQVAPYSSGPQTIRIPLSKLGSILKAGYK
ncbi:DUF3298 domain-containing protein [Patescibacteria group bacterium]|nr:DUF3298 domain-containing protein [Patescibacteria group bacterium]